MLSLIYNLNLIESCVLLLPRRVCNMGRARMDSHNLPARCAGDARTYVRGTCTTSVSLNTCRRAEIPCQTCANQSSRCIPQYSRGGPKARVLVLTPQWREPRPTKGDHVCVCVCVCVRMALCLAADLYTDTCMLTSTSVSSPSSTDHKRRIGREGVLKPWKGVHPSDSKVPLPP